MVIAAALVLVSWADNRGDVEQAAQKITSINAEFTQTKKMELLARPLVSTGKFYYRQPGSLRWEYTSPVQSVLMLHSGSLHRYIKTRQGFVEDDTAKLKSMAVVLTEITSWFRGTFDANPDFEARLQASPSKAIILTPKSPGLKKIISSIELQLSDRPGVIHRVVIREGEKNLTILEFRNIGINAEIQEELFTQL